MKFSVISIGHKMPDWIKSGFEEYAKRFPIKLIEVHPNKTKDILSKIPEKSLLIALDEQGEQWDTKTLATHIKNWQLTGKDSVFLIGGADGHDPALLKKADKIWSLSKLTFPHMFVRVLVAEQLYRALSIISGHPYHRE